MGQWEIREIGDYKRVKFKFPLLECHVGWYPC